MVRLSLSNLFLVLAILTTVYGFSGLSKATSAIAWVCTVYACVSLWALFRWWPPERKELGARS